MVGNLKVDLWRWGRGFRREKREELKMVKIRYMHIAE